MNVLHFKLLMKNQIKFLALLLVVSFQVRNVTAQKSCCCIVPATQTFAMLTNQEKFVNAHLEPLPFVLTTELGKNFSFKCADGIAGIGYEIKSKTPSNKYVFVIHEWWGLNDYIKLEAEKIYANLNNVNVIALDLYDGKIAETRDSAAKYMQSVQTTRAINIINGAIAYVGKDAKIATIGWCFGGGWSMQASLLAAKQNVACVMYYGMPEEKLDRLITLNAPVLFVWPNQDQWINKEVVTKFKDNMNTANKSLTVLEYAADHAFANPSNPKYSKDFANDAFTKAMAFIAKGF